MSGWKLKKTALESLKASPNMLKEVFSYLSGNLIVHKIALLDKYVRVVCQ